MEYKIFEERLTANEYIEFATGLKANERGRLYLTYEKIATYLAWKIDKKSIFYKALRYIYVSVRKK